MFWELRDGILWRTPSGFEVKSWSLKTKFRARYKTVIAFVGRLEHLCTPVRDLEQQEHVLLNGKESTVHFNAWF